MATPTEDNVRRYQELVEAFNRHDAERGAAMYHEDAVVTDHGLRQTMSGREQIRSDYWQDYLDGSSDVRVEDVEIVGAGEWTTARGLIRATHDGSWAGMEATGRRYEVDVCDVVRWREGAIVEGHFYYDLYTILEQLGRLPSLSDAP